MKLRVLVIGPNNRTFSHIVYQPSVRLGSHADCEVPIPAEISPVVSRYHALIDLTEDGVFVTDLQSTNGTWLNGTKLIERTPLQPADEIRLGQQGPIVRAFAFDDQPDAEGTVHETSLPRPATPAPKPKVPPPPPVAALPLSPPPPLPAARAAKSSAPSARDSRDDGDDSGSYYGDRGSSKPARRSRKQNNQLYVGLIGGGVLIVAAVVGILIWQFGGKKKDSEQAKPLTPEEIHRRTVKSSAFVMVKLNAPPPNDGAIGSGSLIDREKKLVLTAYHVIDGATEIKIIFPKFDKDGKPISSFKEYGPADTITARVLKSDSNKDLAILQLDSLPNQVQAIPLAANSPEPGEEVHTVGGSPKESIGLWIYSKGNVREVQEDHLMLDGRQKVDAWVIRTSNPINQGDSGGGLVNKNCELVGVCCASKTKADLVRVFIDIREVKKMLTGITGTSPPKIPRIESNPTGIIDSRKLIGRWTTPDKKGEVQFTVSGMLILSENGKSLNGSYRVVNDKLTLTFNVGGKEKSEMMTIKTLTDERLVTIDDMGKEEELRKVN